MKRTIGLILCILLCMSLCSCGIFVWRGSGNEPSEPTRKDPTQTTAPAEEATEPPVEYTALALLPAADLGGATVVITASSAADFASDGEDSLDAALTARTVAVQEKYNVSVAVTERDPQKIYDELREHAGAGTYYSDLIAIPMSWVGKFARDGLIQPLSDFAGIDLSASYYTATDAFSDRGAVYAAAGAADTADSYAYCVYFNRALADAAGLDLYAEAASGAWTWPRFAELVRGKTGAGFAFADDEEFVNAVMTSSGITYSSYENGVRTCTYAGERASGSMAIATELYHGGSMARSEDPASLFAGGGCYFYVGTLGEAKSFSDMPDSYGILPLPTYGAGEEYRSYVSGDLPVLCIPAGGAAGEHAATVYAALQAASDAELTHAYLSYLANYCLRDSKSVENARLVGERMAYDYVYAFGPKHNPVANCTYWAVQQTVLAGRKHDGLYRAYLPEFEEFVN